MRIVMPIFLNHNQQRIIGHVTAFENGGLVVEITDSPIPINRDKIFEMFGTVGFRILDHSINKDGNEEIRKIEIMEFSLCVP